jgi:hypothetical protein
MVNVVLLPFDPLLPNAPFDVAPAPPLTDAATE